MVHLIALLLLLFPSVLHSLPISPPPTLFSLPPSIKKVHLNIGANLTPLHPPRDDPSTAVIVVEPNIGIANYLRETYQKKKYVNRFFVINCAIAGPPLAGKFSTFHHYNVDGTSSSLSKALKPKGKTSAFANRKTFKPIEHFGPGPGGVDFVPVISLQSFLDAVPKNVEIEYLKMDTQGYDFNVVRSAGKENLKRVGKIMSEVYLEGIAEKRYEGVKNDLHRDWVPYMKMIGWKLVNPPTVKGGEYDAVWVKEN